VLVAGEPERIAMKQRSVEGIYIDDSTWGQLESTAKHVGLTEEEVKAIVAD
jgi:LDH2 family malate/lactate/ureidoglycolate dehydrogenase